MLLSCLPGVLEKGTEPWLEGMGRLLIYFSFFWGFPSLSQFSFPPCGISHFQPPHPRPVPATGEVGWEQKERLGPSFA